MLLNIGNSFKHIKKKIQAKQNISASWISSWKNQIKELERRSTSGIGLLRLGAGQWSRSKGDTFATEAEVETRPYRNLPFCFSRTGVLVLSSRTQNKPRILVLDNRKFMQGMQREEKTLKRRHVSDLPYPCPWDLLLCAAGVSWRSGKTFRAILRSLENHSSSLNCKCF